MIKYHQKYFPNLVSYNHFVELMPHTLIPLIYYLNSRQGKLLRKRSLIETVNDQLQNISQLVHSRHRSVFNFMVNVIAGLIAYTFQDKKPSLKLDKTEVQNLPALLV